MMGIQIYKYLIKNTSRNHPSSHLFSSTFLSPITSSLSQQSTILSSLIHHLEEMRLDILSQFDEMKNKGFRESWKFISIISSHFIISRVWFYRFLAICALSWKICEWKRICSKNTIWSSNVRNYNFYDIIFSFFFV